MEKAGCLLLAVFLLLQACSTVQTDLPPLTQPEPASVSTPAPATESASTPPDPFAEQVRNAEYQLGLLDQVRIVRLSNGRYEQGAPGGADYVSVSMTDFLAIGDLNADGENEAAALVTENYDGTGVFVFLAVFENRDETPVFLTSTFLDDRPQVNRLTVDAGEVFIDAVIHDADDPMCCPTLPTTRRYRLNGLNMVLTYYTSQPLNSQPRVITIEAPIDGVEVSGSIWLKGNVTVAPFEQTLVYRIYDMGGLELSVGPVPVDSPDIGAPGAFDEDIDLGRILTDTAVRIAVQDISAADGSLLAMDSVILQVR